MKRLLVAAGVLASLPALAVETVHNIVDDGWATAAGHRFSGRVTETHPVAPEGSGKRRTAYDTTRLLFASGIAGRVSWSVGPLRWESRADDQGYWELIGHQPLSGLEPGWHTLTSTPGASSNAGLLVHDPRNQLGLISDIDDTIVVTDVNRTHRLLENSLIRPPTARQAVPGMAALYRRLIAANPHPEATPLVYVSAAPRQLTDSVRRFLNHNGFPRGVLQLKEVASGSSDPLTDQRAYKVRRITAVLKAFPDVRFVLLGDDGEFDPESFAELAAAYPDQVAEIWIRRVHPDPNRPKLPGQGDMAELLERMR